jgi:hypothetical protein
VWWWSILSKGTKNDTCYKSSMTFLVQQLGPSSDSGEY